MRGIGFTLSRLPATRAFLAGAAFLASASLRPGHARAETGDAPTDEVALAVPRVALPGGAVPLPQPLSRGEAARIRRVLAFQAADDIPAALAEQAQLTDPSLLGPILADRYLGHPDRTAATDLAAWLAHYSDQPDAAAIRAALASRLPRGAALPPLAARAVLGAESPEAATPEEEDPAGHALVRNALLDRTVHLRAKAGEFASALRLVSATRGLDALYRAQLRAEVAQAMFLQGRDAEALSLGQEAFRTSGGRAGLAAFSAGLAAWRMDRPATARTLFEAASRASLLPASTRAGAAFWAARAQLRTGNPLGWRPWMLRAAAQKRTFYGLLAGRALGEGHTGLDDEPRELLASADVDALAETAEGRRAFALLQVGQPARAEAELRQLWPAVGSDLALQRSIRLVAEAAEMPDLAAQLATMAQDVDGRPRDAARFPVPRLAPRGGFVVDRALVYALTRLESNFDAGAVSAVGARGLMQLMPVTAGYVSGNADRYAGRAGSLHDPALNLQLGQRYVLYLSGHDTVANNLIRLLASYNAGPGNVGHWDIHCDDDPLMFMESIPFDETRGFVHRALTYTWIYADRLGLPAPSLDALATGAWPKFDAAAEKASAVRVLH
ncbi:MAG: transglycosylase SLT domain-containing protein [Janthinobacterium lividum]